MKKSAIILLFFLSGIATCFSQVVISKCFNTKIQEIYSQHWVAGVRGGGSGTNIFMQFKKPLSKDIQLQKMFFQDIEMNIIKTNDSTFGANFSVKGKRISDPQETEDNIMGIKKKPKYILQPNQAIVEYLQKGKKKRFKISNIKVKEMLAYPSARPRN